MTNLVRMLDLGCAVDRCGFERAPGDGLLFAEITHRNYTFAYAICRRERCARMSRCFSSFDLDFASSQT